MGADIAVHGRLLAGARCGRVARFPLRVERVVLAVSREYSRAQLPLAGANPGLSARQVAAVLKRSASGRGVWTPSLGFGVLDAAAAVELAPTIAPAVPAAQKLLSRTPY